MGVAEDGLPEAVVFQAAVFQVAVFQVAVCQAAVCQEEVVYYLGVFPGEQAEKTKRECDINCIFVKSTVFLELTKQIYNSNTNQNLLAVVAPLLEVEAQL
jgi:hypothetical protein